MLPLGSSVAEKVLKNMIAAGKAADGDVSLDDASKLVDARETWLGLVNEVTKREPAAARAPVQRSWRGRRHSHACGPGGFRI
jgi:hypothetical protein